jgi:prolyl 4-hydroxylase
MFQGKYMIIILILFIIIIVIIVNSSHSNKNDFFTIDNYASMSDPYDEPYIINNIITKEEAKYIIDNASIKFNDSTIAGQILDTSIRKSKTAWLYKETDPIIFTIITRIANIVKLPLENTEALQVVKYQPNGYYKEHHDSCCDNNDTCNDFIKRGGQRIKTVLIYLNDDFTEGATYFPVLNKKYKPPKYSAIIFNPLAVNCNKCHPKALHAGLPVASGVKYVANLWFREREFI